MELARNNLLFRISMLAGISDGLDLYTSQIGAHEVLTKPGGASPEEVRQTREILLDGIEFIDMVFQGAIHLVSNLDESAAREALKTPLSQRIFSKDVGFNTHLLEKSYAHVLMDLARSGIYSLKLAREYDGQEATGGSSAATDFFSIVEEMFLGLMEDLRQISEEEEGEDDEDEGEYIH